MQVQKTVFISYRRTNMYMARAVYQDLRARGYDAFLDYQSLDSGDFSQSLLSQISARAHFVVILTPSALERCSSTDDWLRKEIEYAIEQKRNVVPLLFEGFKFEDVGHYLVSDWLKVRKPFMVIGGLISAAGVLWFALQTTHSGVRYEQWIPPILLISVGGAIAFAAWFAAFTETVEKHNPAATATGLSV